MGTSNQLTTKGWTNHPPLSDMDDIDARRTNAPYQFMAPYPASLFKLMLAFHCMRMVDVGAVTLDKAFTFSAPTPKTKRVPSAIGLIR